MTDGNLALRRSRLGLIGLAALFLVPLGLSFAVYYGTSWRPSGGTQHGELILPPRPLPAVGIARADGGAAESEGLRGAWHLVYLAPAACDTACEQTLATTRQVRLALDKDMPRVRRLYLQGAGAAPLPPALAPLHPDLFTAAPAGEEGARLIAAFTRDATATGSGEWFLVDPLGNLMMAYPADVAPKGLLKDLERLLKLSHIG